MKKSILSQVWIVSIMFRKQLKNPHGNSPKIVIVQKYAPPSSNRINQHCFSCGRFGF